eukprot:2697289-Pyramimonas_sp.AAC.1
MVGGTGRKAFAITSCRKETKKSVIRLSAQPIVFIQKPKIPDPAIESAMVSMLVTCNSDTWHFTMPSSYGAYMRSVL